MYPNNIQIINPIDILGQTSFYVETFFDDTYVTNATAFFYKHGDEIYLVSNWHIFSGRISIPDSNGIYQPNHEQMAIPNKIKVWVHGWDFHGKKYPDYPICWEFPIIDQDNNNLYIEKQLKDGTYIDVAMLPIKNKFIHNGKDYGIPICVNNAIPPEFENQYTLHPTDDIYIIGFPFGNLNHQYMPIWKRGSIAQDLRIQNYRYYIDTATRSGMSGSPIYRIITDINSLLKSEKGQIMHSELVYKAEFIGIYSGREIEPTKQYKYDANKKIINDYDLTTAAQLGIAWKKDVLEILLNQ